MIVVRTPYRVSFFGGGSDYPEYYKENSGAVISSTINKYSYLTCRYLPPYFDFKYKIRYFEKELVNSLDEIQHPSIRECLRFLNEENGIDLVHTGDIPAMSGIGSSSSFTVGMLHALHTLQGRMVTKRQLAYDAIHIEQQIIGESVGSQDQVAAAFGGFNRINFKTDGQIIVDPITINNDKIEKLQDNLMFFFTGISRLSSDITAEKSKISHKKANELACMHQMVDESISILNGDINQLDNFGYLLNESWLIKRGLTSKITNETIDEIYQIAINAGALGGKITGAGGGGFIMFYVPLERQQIVKQALKNLLYVPIRFETLGSHIAFYSQNHIL
jgi:D-glycero-alpha-D-manno-heptose-7-phosphate kinase